VLDDPEIANRLARRGLRRVRESYSWGVAADQYMDLFGDLLNSHVAT